MDHSRIVTATIRTRDQIGQITHRKISYLENIYGIPADMRLNFGEYLGNNRLLSGRTNLPLKVIKPY